MPADDSAMSKLPYQSKNEEEFSRRFFRQSVIHEVIIFLLRYWQVSNKKTKSSMITGFLMVWRSRSTPYVRIHEVLRALKEDWISLDCPQKCWKKLYKVCNNYSLLFSDISEGPLGPRSLKHLSRCAVRNELMRAKWSFGISRLNIPPKIKSYLLLQS